MGSAKENLVHAASQNWANHDSTPIDFPRSTKINLEIMAICFTDEIPI
jgi:hypothetical protein